MCTYDLLILNNFMYISALYWPSTAYRYWQAYLQTPSFRSCLSTIESNKCLPQVERSGLQPSPDPLHGLNSEFWIQRKRSPTSPLWTQEIDSDHTLIFPLNKCSWFSHYITYPLATVSVLHGVTLESLTLGKYKLYLSECVW